MDDSDLTPTTLRKRGNATMKQLILSLLSSTPSQREARSFLKRLPSPLTSTELTANTGPPLLGLFLLPPQATSVLSDSDLKSLSLTLVQLKTLGLHPWLILDAPSSSGTPFTPKSLFESRQALAVESSRICQSIEEAGGRALSLYNGVLCHDSSAGDRRNVGWLKSGLSLARAQDQIPLIAPLITDSHSQIHNISGRESLLHLVRLLSKEQSSSSTISQPHSSPHSHLTTTSFGTLSRCVVIRHEGGLAIPSDTLSENASLEKTENNTDRASQKALGFVNLEDEYGSLRQTLLTARDCADQVGALDTTREALLLMPPYSSGILMAPSAAPSLISNLVTEKPLSSSSALSTTNTSLDSSTASVNPPTLFRKGLSVKEFTHLGDLNQDRLWALLEASFSKSLLTDSYDARLDRSLDRIILTGDYQGAAIITREGPHHLPYLDKFSVAPSAQGMGVADILWTRIRNLYPDLFWRSRTDNPVNKWYFDRSDGNARLEEGHWMLFWYGSRGLYELEKYIPAALKIPPSFESAPVSKKKNKAS